MNDNNNYQPTRLPNTIAPLVVSAISTILETEVSGVAHLHDDLPITDLQQEVSFVDWILVMADDNSKPLLRVILDYRDSGIYIYHNDEYSLPLPKARQIHGLCREYDVMSWSINADSVNESEDDDVPDLKDLLTTKTSLH